MTCRLIKYMKQRTIGAPFTLQGKGLHTGLHIEMHVKPAAEDTGIVIKRVDLPAQPCVAALAEYVTETTRGTVLRSGDVQVGTVEHGLAALYAAGIDNCWIEVNAPEFPILDGSAKIYMEQLAKVGVVEQNREKNYLVIDHKIVYEAPNGVSRIEIVPADTFALEVEIEFDSSVLGHQVASIDNLATFADEVAPCRTFVFVRELEPLLKMNLIRGGDLTNALVIYDKPVAHEELQRLSDLLGQPCPQVDALGYLNADLRFENEPARHKLLDLIGDLSLVGRPILGKVVAYHPGHSVNTALSKHIRQTLCK